ncbi:hypothetical protein A1O7_04064 [Cladophialophora yegresii CBS 114405]|uniref:Uncharacterized protein n=1 Tax=Cladophialophora yegresii CBS 114405 TaxID=1182544 RepID=W9VVU0_9EURO|nr:uncharacterized protein A1O7_04064 [Cladophialophora yegresii CBS 114405]EXJ59917.1 hypothetical protein A1O7_04064 [Cladophialophora yegresii CBS 114405]
MAVFCDLEDDECSSRSRSRFDADLSSYHDQLRLAEEVESGTAIKLGHVKNVMAQALTTNKLAAVLTCYPVALSLSSHLDLNDLYSLAATCHGVHASLTQYSRQLKSQSLRCSHDGRPVLAEALWAQRDRTHAATEAIAGGSVHIQPTGIYDSIGVSSKISSCARDLVGPCRKCGTIVCRNCTVKPLSNIRLKERLRRLCKTCLDAPIEAHFHGLNTPDDPIDAPPASKLSTHAFTSPAFLRGPCTCESRGVFLCAPCGGNLRAADTTYQRVFTWRSRYSTHIGGGLGTGLGLGNQGQKCGRGASCLDTSSEAVSWVETDCPEDKTQDTADYDGHSLSRVGTPDSSSNKPGYLQQEVEGIGGVLKKKVKRRVKTGACTYEYADERESGKYLERERTGAVRSWCGWCARVVPSLKDKQDSCLDQMAV